MSIWKEFFVSQSGCDRAEGTAAHPFRTLKRAAAAVRLVNREACGDIVVHLQGELNLDEPFTLYAGDSGFNGHKIIYKGENGASITGYKALKNWKRDENGVWHACALGVRARQIFLDDGIRLANASAPRDPNWKVVPEGYECPPGFLAGLRSPGDLEFAYNHPCWEEGRLQACGARGDVLLMKQPGFRMAAVDSNYYSIPDKMYNAYEFINGDNQWCVDTRANEICCRFAENVDPNEHLVRLCALDQLVILRGSYDAPVHDIVFDGVTFQYATWLLPNDAFGLIAIQANCRQVAPRWLDGWSKPIGTVVGYAAKNCAFLNNVFTHMGGTGLSLERGCCDNLIEGNRFYDLGNGAVTLGDNTRLDAHPFRGDARIRVMNNRILNNYVTRIGVDHPGMPAVTVWHTTATEIAHNEIAYVPYTGISLGWGWGANDTDKADPTIESGHYIHHNHIHHVLLEKIDGGAVYLLGSLPGTLISCNNVHDQPHDFGTLYYDDGTQWVTMANNIVYNTVRSVIMKGAHNTLFDNYFEFDDNNMIASADPSNATCGNHVLPDLNFPLPLLNGAGLERPYLSLLPEETCADKARFKTVRTFDGRIWRNTAADEGNGSRAVNGDTSCLTDELTAGSGWLVDLGRGYDLNELVINGAGQARLLIESTVDGNTFEKVAELSGPGLVNIARHARDVRVTITEGRFALSELAAYTGTAPRRDKRYVGHELGLVSLAAGRAYVGEAGIRLVPKGVYADGLREAFRGETRYTVSDETVARVDENGHVDALADGVVTLRCEFDGVTLETALQVYTDVIETVSFRTDRTCYHAGENGSFTDLSARMLSGRVCDLNACTVNFTADDERILKINGYDFLTKAPGMTLVTATVTFDGHRAEAHRNISVMPAEWDCALLGRAVGELEFDGRNWHLTNTGDNVFSAADHCSYLYRFVDLSDYPDGVTVVSRFDDIDNHATGITMAGVMIRPRITADSMCVTFRYQPARFVREDKTVPWAVPVTMRMADYCNTGCASTPTLKLGNRLLLTYKDKTVYLHQQTDGGEPVLVYKVENFDAGERFSLGVFHCSGDTRIQSYACGSDLQILPNTIV